MKFHKFYNLKDNYINIVPDFLSNIFIRNNFHVYVKDNVTKKIIIFFLSNNFLRKLKLFFYILLNSKIIFKEPNQKKIIIFDKYSELVIKEILKARNFFTLATRPKHFKSIYVSKKIIFFLIKNFFKQSIKINYLTILIKILNPKIIVTMIDQSLDFYIIEKIFKKKNISFVALQNAYRDQSYLKDMFAHNDYSQKYYSFGQDEIKTIKKHSKRKLSLKSIGSARAAVAKEYLKTRKFSLSQKIDICLVSELSFVCDRVTEKELKSHIIRISKLASYCQKFSIKNNKKILLLGRYSEPLGGHTVESLFLKKVEEVFYKPFLKAENLYLKFPNRSKFENFNIMKNSNLILGTSSTMLLESFAFKKKFLICEWGNVKQSKMKVDGICKLKLENYSHFESRILNLLKINYADFKSKNKNMNLIYNTNIDTFRFLRQELSSK